MAKNNKVNNKERRFRKIRECAVRLILIISTVMLMAIGTINVVQFGAKIVSTQAKMFSYYISIGNLEDDREYYSKQARYYSGETRRNSQHLADKADAAIDTYNDKRNAIVTSSDPVIAFAAKDHFSIFMSFFGLSCFAGIAGIWYLVYRYFVAIIQVEKKIFDSIVLAFFWVGSMLFYALYKLFWASAQWHRRINLANSKSKRRPQPQKVVPFKKKRVG